MDDSIFSASDAAIAKAHGSRDPEVVADYSNILIGAPLSGTIGDDEAAQNALKIKNMATGEEKTVPAAEAPGVIRNMIG